MAIIRDYVKNRFVNALTTGASRSAAAIICGTHYKTVWRWINKDEAFKAMVEEAVAYSKHVKVDNMINEGEEVVAKCLKAEDLDTAFKAASLVLERKGGWVKPNAPQPITGIAGQPIETKDVTVRKMSDNEAARRICLILAKGMVPEEDK